MSGVIIGEEWNVRVPAEQAFRKFVKKLPAFSSRSVRVA